MKLLRVISAVCLLPASLDMLGQTPPRTPPPGPPPAIVYGPPDNDVTPVPPPDRSYLPADPAKRRALILSSALTPREEPRGVASSAAPSEPIPPSSPRTVPWRIGADAIVVDPVTTVATDPRGVEEPVIINLVKYGATHTLTSFIRRITETPRVEFNVRNEWSYRDSTGVTSGGLMPLPAGYTDSADPVLAHNGTTGGISPLNTYAVGLALNREPAPSLGPANPSSIRVWISVNGGYSWTGTGSEVDVIPSGTALTLDKPWITVSEVGGWTGYVFVSWVRYDTTGANQNQLMFRRSRNGVSKPHVCCGYPTTWDNFVQVTDTGFVQGPQIVVDNAGYVYVIFVDFATRQMRIARSRFPAANFPSDGSSVFLPAQNIAPFNRIFNNTLSGVRVVPLPAARYNAAANEILVAWSEGETDNASRGNIRLVRVSADTNMTVTPVPLSTAIVGTGVDEFTPVIETDGSGTVMLAYYDRRGMSGTNYQARIAKLTSAGTLIPPVFPDTNPTPLGAPCAADFVGEYQGLWRGSYPAGFRYDMAWTCSDAALNRTIQRVGVQ